MIRRLTRPSSAVRRRWRRIFVPVAVLDLVDHGRSLVVCQIVQTRWSHTLHRRLWKIAEAGQ